MAGGNGYREVLALREARALLVASATSQLGDWLYNAALLGYVYAATGSAAWLGAATILRLLPYTLLGPLGGVVADRYNRRTVLLASDLLRSATMLALAVVVARHGSIAVVLALTSLASALGTAARPAAMSWLPRLVGVSRLGPANALLHTVQDLGIVLGPAIGAVILVVGSASAAFVVNAVTFAISAAFVATIRRGAEHPPGQREESPGSQLRTGLRLARTTSYVVPLIVVVALVELIYGAQTVQLVVYAEGVSRAGSAGYGYLLAAAGLGGVLSAAVNGRLAKSSQVSAIVVGAACLAVLPQLAFAATEVFPLALMAAVVGGFGLVACEVVAETALARVAPQESLGRLMGVLDACAVGAMVLGALVAPVLVNRTSLTVSLVVTGVAGLGAAALCLGPLRGLDLVSRRRAEQLSERMALVEDLPIVTGVSRFGLEQLASAAVPCALPDGVDVIVKGAPAHAFYVILDGSVVVERDGRQVAQLGAGDYFGERGLLDAAPRNATATTVTPSTLLRISGDVLLEVLQASPGMRSTLDRSNVGPTGSAPPGTGTLVDDSTWVPERGDA